MKRTPLRRMSAKRQTENRQRRERLEAFFGKHPRCSLCDPLQAKGIYTGCNGWADDGDEILSRARGGSITDVSNVRPVGRPCHSYITTHPAVAEELGLVSHSWESK